MNTDNAVSWTAFIAIIFLIYVAPKAYIITKAKKRKGKRTLPPPAPLLGVIQPPKNRKKDR